MQHIDPRQLEQETVYRFQYLADFIGFGAEDIAAVKAVTPELAPLVPALVDAVYAKLYTYDVTWNYFVMHQSGYTGEEAASAEELTLDHPQIAFRKQHLSRYLERLVTELENPKLVAYLDMVGKIHTPQAGNPEIHVELVHMNALLGFVNDALIQTIMGFAIDQDTKIKAIRSFTKLLWIQNDLINRHYR